jgi:regulator of replication initiation timing
VVLNVTAEITNKKVKKLENTLSHLATQNHILKEENKGLKEAVYNKQKKRKRGKKLEEEFRAQEGGGALFFSPQTI